MRTMSRFVNKIKSSIIIVAKINIGSIFKYLIFRIYEKFYQWKLLSSGIYLIIFII